MQLKPLKQFARIQQTAFRMEDFDGIQHFPECGGIGIFVGTIHCPSHNKDNRQVLVHIHHYYSCHRMEHRNG